MDARELLTTLLAFPVHTHYFGCNVWLLPLPVLANCRQYDDRGVQQVARTSFEAIGIFLVNHFI